MQSCTRIRTPPRGVHVPLSFPQGHLPLLLFAHVELKCFCEETGPGVAWRITPNSFAEAVQFVLLGDLVSHLLFEDRVFSRGALRAADLRPEPLRRQGYEFSLWDPEAIARKIKAKHNRTRLRKRDLLGM